MEENSSLEIRRQAFHIAFGLFAVLLISYGIGWEFFLYLLVTGIGVSFLSRKHRLPLISWFLDYFERKDATIPGRGALFFVAGILLAVVLFENEIALAAIMILTLGDSVSHIFGRFFGRVRYPWNRYKLIEGTLLGFASGAVGAAAFVTWNEAILASAIAMIVEGFELKFRSQAVDDNLIIPLVAGAVIYVLRL
jgi:dolichol kinase